MRKRLHVWEVEGNYLRHVPMGEFHQHDKHFRESLSSINNHFCFSCQPFFRPFICCKVTWVTLLFMKMGRIRGEGMTRSLRLAHGKIYLSRCMGSGGWDLAGGSPTCFFAERSIMVLFPSDPGDAARAPWPRPPPYPRSFMPLCFHFPVSPMSPDWTSSAHSMCIPQMPPRRRQRWKDMVGGKPRLLILFVLAKIAYSGRIKYRLPSLDIFLDMELARKVFENLLDGTRPQEKIGILKGGKSWCK